MIHEFDQPRIRAAQIPHRGRYNPYVDILRGSLHNAGFDVDGISLFSDSPRVLLLHWTENNWVVNHGSGKLRACRLAKRVALLAMMKRLRARGCTVIWFAHNATPHDWDGSTESWIYQARQFFEQVDAVVHLTDASASLRAFDHLLGLPRTVLRHPHYALVDPAIHTRQAGEIQRVLILGGATQPRKNAYSAAQAIQAIPHLRAVITGDLDSRFASGFTSYPKVDLLDGFLGEKSLFSHFDGATAVLLNQANQLNSGVMFLGLSRGAPVICPDTPANREIRSIVGSEWIRLFDTPLTADYLAELTRAPIPSVLPDLSSFDPESLARSFRNWFDKELNSNA